MVISRSDLLAGIVPNFGSAANLAGNLNLDASNKIQIEQQSLIANDVGTNATGNAGNVNIKAPTLDLTDASQIRSRASGSGNGGNITIITNQLNVREGAYLSVSHQFGKGGILQVNADSFDLDGGNANPFPPTSLLAQNFSTEDGAKLSIQTRTLNIRNGAGLSTATFGQGKGGDLTIRATESIIIEGTSSNSLIPSLILTSAFGAPGIQLLGKGGNLSIQTGKLTIRDGAKIEASTSRTGQAGNIDIDAAESVQINGDSRGASNGIFAKSENAFYTDSKNVGSAGRINLKTESLVLQNAATISTTTETGGDGGEIQIRANSLALRENSAILAGTAATGDSGSIRLDIAGLVDLTGSSYITSSTVSRGNSGNIALSTGQLVMKEGAFISTGALPESTGKGGNLNIRPFV